MTPAVLFACFGLVFATVARGAGDNLVTVVGWPLEQLPKNAPPAWVGSDPVVGRLSCPPAIRLNLAAGKAEGLVFEVTPPTADQASNTKWHYRVKNGIFWWSGAAVTPQDSAEYVSRVLREVVKSKGVEKWLVPAFKVEVDGSTVVVSWSEAPDFGPYVLMDYPLWRPAKGTSPLAYECAGTYRVAAMDSTHLLLDPAPGYGASRRSIELRSEDGGDKGRDPAIAFLTLKSLNGGLKEPGDNRAGTCATKVDLPYMTLLQWNLESKRVERPQIRKALGSLIPKGALLRSGAGNLGDLVSAPIPRHHPGYNSAIKVPKFALVEGRDQLVAAGFMEGISTGTGGRGKLELAKLDHDLDLVDKVLTDTLELAGIDLRIMQAPIQGDGNRATVDGYLYTARSIGNDFNFLPTLYGGSRPPQSSGVGGPLKVQLTDYLHFLSHGIFNKLKLQKIHAHLAELEPVTVLLHHGACLVIDPKLGKKVSAFDTNDPDWFRRLVTQL